MYFGMKKRCFHCGTEMKLHRKGYVDIREKMFVPTEDWSYVEMYYCPNSRHVDWVLPITPLVQFEAEQKAKEEMTSVEKFEYTFRDYTDKELGKIVESKGYVDDAKEAAKNLIHKRKFKE